MYVFPELEERLRAVRAHLEWVDLRIGIATASLPSESVGEQQVPKVCLAETRRCRPFLIVLLGDGYGWIPPGERAARAASDEGLDADVTDCSVTDLEIRVGVLPRNQRRTGRPSAVAGLRILGVHPACRHAAARPVSRGSVVLLKKALGPREGAG